MTQQWNPTGGRFDVEPLENINGVADLPDLAQLDEAQIYSIRSGDFAPDYVVPWAWDSTEGEYQEWRSTVDGQVIRDTPDSAIHQYRFDEGSGETAFDSIGSVDASITGANWDSSAGQGGFHLQFDDGDNDKVDISSIYDFTIGKFAVSFWLNPSELDGPANVCFQFEDFDPEVILVDLDRFSIRDGDDTRSEPGWSPSQNEWQHVVAQFDVEDKNTQELYKNKSKEIDVSPDIDLINMDGSTKLIGLRPDDETRGFYGGLDHFIFFDRILSQDEIDGLYDNQVSNYE